MKLEKAMEALYDLIALDKNLRKEILKDLVQDDTICMLISISNVFNIKGLTVTRGGNTTNFKYQIGQILVDHKGYWEALGLKEQVVMKELLSMTNTFDSTIFYAHANTVYNKKEILEYFKVVKEDQGNIPYILMDSPKYYWVVREGRTKFNNTPKGMATPFCMPHNTMIFSPTGKILANGVVSLGDYLQSKGTLSKIYGDVKYGANIPAIQYSINKKMVNKYALVFHQDGAFVIGKELVKETYDIIDLMHDENFEVMGIWCSVGVFSHLIKTTVPQTMLDKGVDKYTVTIKCTKLLNGDINNVEFVKFNVKEGS